MSAQLPGRRMVTDGGLETDLIFHHAVDLPYFAAFPLLDNEKGRALLADYYAGYAAIAQRAGTALMLETPTWRASRDWGDLLGYAPPALARINRSAIMLLDRLRDRYRATVADVVVGGMVGPRGDGYHPDRLLDPTEAQVYHAPQIQAFAEAGADLVTAYTITHTGEAIGIVRAARAAGLPVAISFTVETDGRLPAGESLAAAITAVERGGRTGLLPGQLRAPDPPRARAGRTGPVA